MTRRNKTKRNWNCILNLLFTDTCNSQTICSPENRESEDGLAACLQAVRDTMINESAFWFGTDYAERCPVPEYTMECQNLEPTPASMADRLFFAGTFDPATIEHFMEVTIHEMPGKVFYFLFYFIFFNIHFKCCYWHVGRVFYYLISLIVYRLWRWIVPRKFGIYLSGSCVPVSPDHHSFYNVFIALSRKYPYYEVGSYWFKKKKLPQTRWKSNVPRIFMVKQILPVFRFLFCFVFLIVWRIVYDAIVTYFGCYG